jgi:transmembrane sensor
MEKQNNNHKEIRDKIQSVNEIPDHVNWNVNSGWEQYKRKYRNKGKIKSLYWLISLAAAGILVFALLFLPESQRKIRLVKTSNQKKNMTLSDGSRIWLNKNTQITIHPNKNLIEMQGEVYIEFSGAREYKIQTPNGIFHSRNAHFNLKSQEYSNRSKLTVSEGSVNTTWDKENNLSSEIKAGIQAEILPEIAVLQSPLEDRNYLAWKTGNLYFEHSPLYLIIEKLKELNHTEIQIENRNMRYCRMTSRFETTDTDFILNKIPEYLECTVEKKGNHYVIKGKGCKNSDI